MIDSDMLAASMQTGLNIEMRNPIDDTHDYVNELEQDNKRLQGLLRRWNNQTHICVFCNGWLTWIGELGDEDKKGHADDCELAEELGDD